MGRKPEAPPPLAEPSWLRSLWLLLWLAAFAALACAPDEKLVRQKLLALEAAVWTLVATLAAGVLSGAWTRRATTPLDLPVLAYAAAGLCFYALSPERGVSLPEATRTAFAAAVFFAAAQTLPSVEPGRIAAAWGASAAGVAAYALLQLRGGLGPFTVPLDSRPFATFGNPIFLGAYLSASACAAAGLAWAESGARRHAAAAAAALCAAGALATQSRAALAGLGGAAALATLLYAGPRARAAAGLGLASLAVAAAALFRDRSWTHGLIWRDTLSLWTEHPWLGCGLGRYHVEFPAFASAELKALWPQQKVIVNFAHNEYLQVLAETGVAGLAALLAVVGGFFAWWRRAAAAPQDDPYRARLCAGLAAAAAALWIQALASPDLRFGVSSFVAFFAMAAAAAWSGPPPRPAPPAWRAAAAPACLLFLGGWGWAAVQPFLAQRRLALQPGFHVEASPEVKAALERLEARLKAEPSNADVAEQLAYLYAKERAWEPAIERYQLVIRLSPGRPGPYNNLGNLFYSTGDLPQAIEQWKRSVMLKPDQLDAHLNLGKALYETGRLKESAAHLQAALRLDPKNEKAQILLRKMVE
ncbi:MAG: tetratricopeptide repeat protein [Elusimicrobia bacterium]|nr:tetratricopeptide repeat protein [Elusimicrobiota bacterium]